MLQPKRTKFRKQLRARTRASPARRNVSFGEYGLKATEPRPHDGAPDRGGAPRHDAPIKRGGQHLDPRLPRQADHQEAARSPHGHGKGNVEYWVAEVVPGKVLFEMEGVSEAIAREAFRSPPRSSPCRRRSSSGRSADEGDMKATRPARQGAERAQQELLKLRREQFSLRMQRATGQAAKPDQFGKVRKNIARVKTRAAHEAAGGKARRRSTITEAATPTDAARRTR